MRLDSELKSPKTRNSRNGSKFTKINTEGEWLWVFQRLLKSKDPEVVLHRLGTVSLGSKNTQYEKDIAATFRQKLIDELRVPSILLEHGEQSLKQAACGIFRKMAGLEMRSLHELVKPRDKHNLVDLAKAGVFSGNTMDIPLVYGLISLGLIDWSVEELDTFWLAIRRYTEILNGMDNDRYQVICRADTTNLQISADKLSEINQLLISMKLIIASDSGGRLAAVENVLTLITLEKYIKADGFKDTLIIGGPGTGKSYGEINAGRIKGVISLANKIAIDIGGKAHCPAGSYAMFNYTGAIIKGEEKTEPTHVDEIGAFSLKEWAGLLKHRSADLLNPYYKVHPITLMGDDLQQVSFTGRGLILHSIIRELGLTYPKAICRRIKNGLPQTEDLRNLYDELMSARIANNPEALKNALSKPRRGVYRMTEEYLYKKAEEIENGEVLVLATTNKQCDTFTKHFLDSKGVKCEYNVLSSFAFLTAPEGTRVLAECTENSSIDGAYNRMRAVATMHNGTWYFSERCQEPSFYRPRYATTVFSSQGLTADHVVLLETKTTSIEVLFTAATRHRKTFSFVGELPSKVCQAPEINNFDELRKIKTWTSCTFQ